MKTFKESCPFREGSASFKIYMTLAASKRPMKVVEIARRAKVSLAKTQTLCAAYFNPMHLTPLLRQGVRFERKDGGIVLGRCKPNPKARRPERGKGRKTRVNRAKRSAQKKASTPLVPKPVPAQAVPQSGEAFITK